MVNHHLRLLASVHAVDEMVFVELRVEASQRVWVIGFALQESALAWCYLVVRHGVRCRLTSKLTDRRYLTHKTSQTPRNVLEAQTAVRRSCIDSATCSHNLKN